MSGQQWRKALWHFRNGGIDGLREFRRRTRQDSAASTPAGEAAATPRTEREAEPLLSVVIPAFNAAEFIERCLRSVVAQRGVRLEVIVVDDGSRDETTALVGELIDDDPRIMLIKSTNAGPAAARNLGVEASSGDFITFVDADDEVLPGAFSTMVDSLLRTGSDIATGSYVRIGATGRNRPKLTARVHARQRLAVRLSDMPELLEEPVLWNKVYGREFWLRHVGEMQTFANYEDQEPVYRALVSAAAIDVLTTDVYAWRLADGRRTRSRRKGKLTDLRARLRVIEALKSTLTHEPGNVRRYAFAIWMGTDLAMHAEYLDTASKKFRKSLTGAASKLRKEMPRSAWELIPAQSRLYMWVVASGRLEDIEEVLGTRAEETTAVPLDYVNGHWAVAPTYLTRLTTRIPPRLVRAHEVDFNPRFIVRNVRWVDDRIIELQGCAYVPGIRPEDLEFRVRGVMDGATEFDTDVERVDDNRVDLDMGDPWRTYSSGGFRVRLDLGDVGDVSPRGIQIIGAFNAHGVELTTPATSTAVVGMIAPSPITESGRITVVADDHDELSIVPVTLPKPIVVADEVRIAGEHIGVELNGQIDIAAVELIAGSEVVEMRADGTSAFRVQLPPLPDRYQGGGEVIWSLRARTADGSYSDVYFSGVDYLLPGTGRVRPAPNVDGRVQLSQRMLRVTITGASSDRDRLLLTGRIDPPQKLSVVLKSTEQTIGPIDFRLHADGEFTAVYELTESGPEGGTVAALSGGYHIRFGSTPESAEQWARVAGKLALRPVDSFTEWNTIRVEGRPSGMVAVTASPPWSAKERTRFGRFALRDVDWGPLQKGIVFESYNGKSANDNPRAIFDAIREEDPTIPLYWSVRDRRVDVPPGGIPVVEGTAEWHRALATSKVWVNNNNFPYYVRKREGQFYLQTWHGTPIKKLLWDIPRRKVPLTYRRLMKTEVAQWDLLLAQSGRAAENLCSGLGFRGETLIGEYPRNARLFIENVHSPETPLPREIGRSEERRVILVAPTWRNRHRSGSPFGWSSYLNYAEIVKNTTSLVLVRAHHVAKSERVAMGNVVDVSHVAHVEELLLTADVLVTDYSSIAYDFAATGKPVVHFIPDAADFENERGLYSNWAGDDVRVARSHAELIDVLNDVLALGPGPRQSNDAAATLAHIVELCVSPNLNTPTIQGIG
ncbi:bifunctional glycosyltransferase/CDP-glycerol:glycerophosphate glycerophosphotransferase [Brevibacterium casei]|uniref:CDP-glycerol glycerophosphotransferase family protein n=1 Tax=Brevibacterium casei TaxID=33889 RepID=A0A7T4A179_9MICO|nr:CDP-glycerol glycerophosphotransferase family protein [Brevibacterium casei]QQB15450.1 CDP-glycerol glycerophosphotransferase family protein [Brevibacterium casei]